MNMIKTAITIALLSTSAFTMAQEITCADLDKNVKKYGTSFFTGLTLEAENVDKYAIISEIKYYKHYDLSVDLINSKNDIKDFRIIDLVEDDEKIVFYTQKAPRSNKRVGEQLVFKKLGDNRFELVVNYAPDFEYDFDTGKFKSIWGENSWNLDRTADKKSIIFKATDESIKEQKEAKCKP